MGRRSGFRLLVAARACDRDPVGSGKRYLQLVARHRWLPRSPPARALPARALRPLAAVRLLHAADACTLALPARAMELRPADGRYLPRLRASARATRALRTRGGRDRCPSRPADHPPRRHARVGAPTRGDAVGVARYWVAPTLRPRNSPTARGSAGASAAVGSARIHAATSAIASSTPEAGARPLPKAGAGPQPEDASRIPVAGSSSISVASQRRASSMLQPLRAA